MRLEIVCVFIVCFTLFLSCESSFYDKWTVNRIDSDIDNDLPTPEIIVRAGYPCETHFVTSEDGYILGVHRIPGNYSHGINASLFPIILHHGLMDSSADWVLSGPKAGLAFLLADKGYDVWLANSRGNIYSKKHTTLSPDDDRFWNFTWHEMGYYDLPAVIDHILKETRHEQLQYIGHSMGTTAFFVMCTTRPEYNNKISYMAALAPVAFLGNTESPIKYLAPFAGNFEKIYDIFGHGELALNSFTRKMLKIACEVSTIQEEICENVLFLIVGFDNEQLDLKLLPLILGHNGAGVSSKTVVHYAQEIRSQKFCQFDHGEEQNILIYNSTTPPEYNLSLITAPMSLHYASNDLLATPADVIHLFNNVHNHPKLIKINFEKFNHLDFLWGRNATNLVYDALFQLLRAKQLFDINILLQEKTETEEKSVPKKEEAKAKEAPKSEQKKEVKGEKNMFASIQEKLPALQKSIVEKLVAVQQFIIKKIGSKGK